MVDCIGFDKKNPFEKPFTGRAKFYFNSIFIIPGYRTPRIARYCAIA
jgi:hypothetical protein